MPSPIGHALAGVVAGWLVAAPERNSRALVIQTALLASLAVAPDLDLLVGRHSGPTHSIGAAAIAASLAAWGKWPLARDRWRIWVAAWIAWASHPLLDALSPDNSPPIGVMAFWPCSHAYVQTGLAIFEPIWRFPFTARMIQHDLYAVVKEIAILTPLALGVWWARKPHRE